MTSTAQPTRKGTRWESGQGYGDGGSRCLADGTVSVSDTAPAASGAAAIAPDAAQREGFGGRR